MQTFSNLVQRFAAGDELSRDEILWAVLVVGMIFASVHLLTMLITRWGDHKATTKSLIFSVLVHFSCGLGMLSMQVPEPPPQPEKPPPEVAQRIFVEGEERVESKESGNTPIFRQPVEVAKIPLSRQERTPLETLPAAAPERKSEEPLAPDLSLPDLVTQPDLPASAPQIQTQAPMGPQKVAVAPIRVDDPLAEARPDVTIPPSTRERQAPPRPSQVENNLQRMTSQGSVDRLLPNLDPPKNLASIRTVNDPAAVIKRGAEEATITRRSGATPTSIPSELTGAVAPRPTEGSAGAMRAAPRIERMLARSPISRENGGLERLNPEKTPSTPVPIMDRGLAVREGSTSPRSDTEKPNFVRPNFDGNLKRKSTSIPATYQLRSLARRRENARKFGGTDASERAVEQSLRWLAKHQLPNGSWDADYHGAGKVRYDENGVDRQNAGKHADVGVTALALLAFLGAGYTNEEGQYADNVDRAIQWLVSQQDESGYLGGKATHYEKMYCHGMASYALAEAYGMHSDPASAGRLRPPLLKALQYIVDNQNLEDGGWRYLKGQKGDMSLFGWQLMALKSGEIAGINTPEITRNKMIQFLKDRSKGERDGLASYQLSFDVSPSMTAEALFCKQMFRIPRNHSSCKEATEYLLKRLPKLSEFNEYYWYYGTLAMYQHGGEEWRTWNDSLRDLLISEQRDTGDLAGSWDPRGPWGPYGGRVYTTALCTLCLEVYYRFLPLNNFNGQIGETR